MTDDPKPKPAQPPTITELHPWVGRLFDMSFRTFVTPSLYKILYGLTLVLIFLQFILGLVVFSLRIGGGWIALYVPIAIIWAVVQVISSRVAVEWVVAFFSAVTNLQRLADHTFGAGTDDD